MRSLGEWLPRSALLFLAFEASLTRALADEDQVAITLDDDPCPNYAMYASYEQ